MDKKHILVIDDEEHILELVKYNLENNGFLVSTFTSVEEALETVNESSEIATILLDIMLPGMDGITALQVFRKNQYLQDTPVILVSAKSEEIDKVLGLELGADDYITKPFSVRELVARVKASVRRSERENKIEKEAHQEKEEHLVYKTLDLDLTSRTLSCSGEKIELTFKEFEIIHLLLENPGKVFTREKILDKVWGYDYYGETRTVDVHIRYLRSKLEEYGLGDCIETVRGVGYKLTKA